MLMALDEREDEGPERESRALRILEAYMMRRKLAGVPTQGASNLAVSVVRALDGKRDTEAAQVIAETLAAQDADSQRWVTAEEVERGVQKKDLYHLRDRAWAVFTARMHVRPPSFLGTVVRLVPQRPARWRLHRSPAT